MLFLTSLAVHPYSWCPPWPLLPPDGAARLPLLLTSLLSIGMDTQMAGYMPLGVIQGWSHFIFLVVDNSAGGISSQGDWVWYFQAGFLAILQISPAIALRCVWTEAEPTQGANACLFRPVVAGGHEYSVLVPLIFIFPSLSTRSWPRVDLPPGGGGVTSVFDPGPV